MMILAEVNWQDIVMVGSAMGILSVVQIGRERLSKKNGNGIVTEKFCNERHTATTKSVDDVKDGIKAINGKIDQIIEHLLK